MLTSGVSLEIHFKHLLSRFGYSLRQVPAAQWENDPAFRDAWKKASTRTLLDAGSAHLLHQLARKAAALEGAAAEVGVYGGGSALVVARALAGSGKALHLFDTFAGLPSPEVGRDLHAKGDFAADEASTREFLKDESGLAFHSGLFPDSAAALADARFAFVHLDADLYRSTLDACRFFVPRMSPGGILVVDDYGVATCPGVKAAVDEFFSGRSDLPLALPSGQCVWENRA